MPYKDHLSSIIFLPVILSIGIITSYQDFKTSRIKNQWIIGGLIYAVFVYLSGWALYAFSSTVNITLLKTGISILLWNFDRWCINLAVGSITAYLLWHYKMWGAGDAKLFICYCALIPSSQYSKVYLNYYYASFLLLMTIFIPATIYLLVRSAIYFTKRYDPSKNKQYLPAFFKGLAIRLSQIKTWKVVLGFFVFFLFFRILNNEMSLFLNKFFYGQNLLMLLSLLLFKQLSKFFKKKSGFMIVALIILAIYIGFKAVYLHDNIILGIGNILGTVLSIMVLFPICKKIIDMYTERTLQKTTFFAPWMFLGALIVWFF